MGKRFLRGFLSAYLILLLHPKEGSPCECTQVMDYSGNALPAFNRLTFSQADIVFLGKALRVDTLSTTGKAVYRFSVQEWFKVARLDRHKGFVEIRTEISTAACGDRFDIGGNYMILGTFLGEKGHSLETTNCAGNSPPSKQNLDSARVYSAGADLAKRHRLDF